MSNKKRKKLTKRQRRRRKIIMFSVELLVILILLAVLWVVIKFNKINHTDLDRGKLNINLDAKTQEMLKGYTNIAIFGLDNRSNGNYESGNSDCIMIASINNDTKDVKLVSVYRDTYLDITDENNFRKLNSAYAKGGPEGAIGALNKNLDLNIEDYVAVDFNAVSEVVDELGGIELYFTAEEAQKTRVYIDEMNKVLGTDSSYISGEGTHLCDGVQATAYSRLRDTAGDDFKRTERQRTVVSKIVEKAKKASLSTINDIIDKVFPDISTNLTLTEMLGLASKTLDYELVDTQGWPFQIATANLGRKGAVVVPTDLETNVVLLHEYLFGGEDYKPTDTVQELSEYIINDTGLTERDTVIDTNPLAKDEEDTETEE